MRERERVRSGRRGERERERESQGDSSTPSTEPRRRLDLTSPREKPRVRYSTNQDTQASPSMTCLNGNLSVCSGSFCLLAKSFISRTKNEMSKKAKAKQNKKVRGYLSQHYL